MKLRICERALELFLEQGYDNTALSQIAASCGLTKAGLYHYFPNKEVLLYEVHAMHIRRNFSPMLDEIEKIQDPNARVESFIKKYVGLMTKDPYARLLIQEVRRLDDDHQAEIKQVWRRAYGIVRSAIVELQHGGRYKKLNPAFASLSVIGMTTWILYWFDYARQDSVEELTEAFVEIFLSGVRQPR